MKRLEGTSFLALDGIDLTIYKGEAVGIIGSNGAGKSTMLKLLSRVTALTEGLIDLYGRVSSMLEVGTSWAAGRDFLQTGEVTAVYEFPLNLLVKGHYYVSVGFYCMNDIGRMVIQDHVTRAFWMEILPKVEIKGWSSRAYGNVQFPDMK